MSKAGRKQFGFYKDEQAVIEVNLMKQFEGQCPEKACKNLRQFLNIRSYYLQNRLKAMGLGSGNLSRSQWEDLFDEVLGSIQKDFNTVLCQGACAAASLPLDNDIYEGIRRSIMDGTILEEQLRSRAEKNLKSEIETAMEGVLGFCREHEVLDVTLPDDSEDEGTVRLSLERLKHRLMDLCGEKYYQKQIAQLIGLLDRRQKKAGNA